MLILKIKNLYYTYNQYMSCCDQDHGHEGHDHDDHEGHAHNNKQQEIIQDQSQEEKRRLKQLRLEKKKAQMLDLKTKFTPLLKFLKKNGLTFKTAAVKSSSVEYFRMDQFRALLQAKKDEINANQNIRELLSQWQKTFIFYQRIENQIHFKWPQQLEQSQKGPQSKFASFPFDSAQSSKIKLVLIVFAILSFVLFPIWPYDLKYFIWIVSYYLTIAMIGLIVVRLILYLLFSVFGASMWIFPRLFDNCQTLQSFKPFYKITWWEGSSVYNVVTRLLILSLFVYYGYHIYIDPTIVEQNFKITQTIMDDINEWGINKIKGETNFSHHSALGSYTKMYNATETGDDDVEDIDLDKAESSIEF